MKAVKIILLVLGLGLAAGALAMEFYRIHAIDELRRSEEQARAEASHANQLALGAIEQAAKARAALEATEQERAEREHRITELETLLALARDPSSVGVLATQGPEDISLRDGRVFRNATIASQNGTTVVIRVPGGAATVPKALLPARFLLPPPTMPVAPVPIIYSSNPIIYSANAAAPGRTNVAAVAPTQDLATKEAVQEDRARAARIAAVKSSARTYAERYFRYDYMAGMSSTVVTRLDLDFDEPTTKRFADEYAIEGRCALEYYDSAGGSLGKKAAEDFVVTVEFVGNQPKVTDFTRHYVRSR